MAAPRRGCATVVAAARAPILTPAAAGLPVAPDLARFAAAKAPWAVALAASLEARVGQAPAAACAAAGAGWARVVAPVPPPSAREVAPIGGPGDAEVLPPDEGSEARVGIPKGPLKDPITGPALPRLNRAPDVIGASKGAGVMAPDVGGRARGRGGPAGDKVEALKAPPTPDRGLTP